MSSLYPGLSDFDPDDLVDYGSSVSGLYSVNSKNKYILELKVDVDQPGPFQEALSVVSGSLQTSQKKKWSGNASTAFFYSYLGGAVLLQEGDTRKVTAQLAVVLSDGGRREGYISAVQKAASRTSSALSFDVKLEIEGVAFDFKGVKRQSQHFRDIHLDIDYVENIAWPSLDLKNFASVSGKMAERHLSLFEVFADAGLKLGFDLANSQQVADPTPGTPWSKADMVTVMNDFFNEGSYNDDAIWCLMAKEPPDQRYMGYSFNNNGKKGFGFFLGHKSFAEIGSDNTKLQANATRRFLHYLVHECGHCMGLKHPFEEGNPNSLSWMNYAWKYDSVHDNGDFYRSFKFCFESEELMILRHQPDKIFKNAHAQEQGGAFEFLSETKSSAPDFDDSDEEEEEDADEDETYNQGPAKRPKMEEPLRKVKFGIKTKSSSYKKGDVVDMVATLKNYGKLPVKFDPNLEPGTGTMTVYVTDPEGYVKVVKPVATGIDAPTRRYGILGKPGSREYSDSYSDTVPLLKSSNKLFDKIGDYQVKAVYQGAGMQLSSAVSYVSIENDDEDDEETKKEVEDAASMETSSSYGKVSKLVKFWEKNAAKPVEQKKSRVSTLIKLFQGFVDDGIEVKTERAGGSGRPKRVLKRKPAPISYGKLLSDTDDLVKYYSENASKDEALDYVSLVEVRSKLYMKQKKPKNADAEFAQLVASLIRSDSDFGLVKRVADKWKSVIRKETEQEEPEDKKLQRRFEDLFHYTPMEELGDYPDKSGLGLAAPFQNFNDGHRTKAYEFIADLERTEEETDDLDAVLDYAEATQKSAEVNVELYRYAIESYVVHSKLAKKHHIRYPEPPKMDQSLRAMAAMSKFVRKGTPNERWMNYWRCDADFNYHHRHWHSVYQSRNFWDGLIRRQGELFVYMHSQMLARYNADRESWGMKQVVEYSYDEKPAGFNAGADFNNAFQWLSPRPSDVAWSKDLQKKQAKCEEKLKEAYNDPDYELPAPAKQKLTPTLAGHIIEATTWEFQQTFGSFHNMGHMGFCQKANTYMGSAQCAVRDPIFFRWHKRVDNVADIYFQRKKTALDKANPGVVIQPCDVLILPGRETPTGFDRWTGGAWAEEHFKSADIKTFLAEPEKDFEWDNKLKHEPFSIHLRMRRTDDSTGVVNATVRVFICQERHVDNRKRWIEMDKFVHRMAEDENHVVLKRLDIHSSVIKRLHENYLESEVKELQFVQPVHGNCDCGWPYEMLLPRGTKEGEKWLLGVFVSNNDDDRIQLGSTCGSMSYCGTADTEYPDAQTMGYPFATPIKINDKVVKISEAAETLPNFCITPFRIVNDYEFEAPKLVEPGIVWSPVSVVKDSEETDYRPSRNIGLFRVLLDDKDFRKMDADRVKLKFKGRGPGRGTYNVRNVCIALRLGNTLEADPNKSVAVTFKSLHSADVPEDGLLTDEIVLPVKTAPGNDYFVTFRLESPGCFVSSKQRGRINTYRIKPSYFRYNDEEPQKWSALSVRSIRHLRSLYCLESVVVG